MIKKGFNQMGKFKVAGAVTAVALALTVSQAQAVEISTDNWSGSWDTTVSAGSSWRMEERDTSRIGHYNLAVLENTPMSEILNGSYLQQGSWSHNGDDSNLNFDKGDTFSQAAKITTELGLQHENGFGFFLRGSYLYDFELMRGNKNRRKPMTQAAIDEQGEDARLLDAYIYQTLEFENSTMQYRLGRQVISWGESTFIQHGLSEINAIDVTKLRVPGSEIKEGLIPVNTIWTSFDLSATISFEAFYQTEWEKFRTDEPGTYFASQDFAGATGESIHLGFAVGEEGGAGTQAFRLGDKDASDSGQYGLKMAWLAEDWNYTEFGFYYVNYHNKRPIISANAWGYIDELNTYATSGFFEYLEDIQMYGLSFNTSTEGGLSIAGEVTYRKDEPLQVDDVELLFATLEPTGAVPTGTSQLPSGAAFGEEISGYRLFDTVQYQATFTMFMGPTWGADQWVLLAEVGGNSVLDMPEQSELRFNAPGTDRSGNPARAGFEGVETNEFASKSSWGYRLVSKWDYTDVMYGWNMSPRIVYQHDVNGTTPGPISNFVEDRKAVTFGLSMDYQSEWKADIGYSAFFDGGTANSMGDKDFLAANISYSF